MTYATSFSEGEAAICVAANMIEEDKTYWVVGGGAPRLATILARKLKTPNVTVITEDGCIGPKPALPTPPLGAMMSSQSCYKSIAWTSMNTVATHAALGLMDYGMLATLQIDPYGNINSTFLGGDYHHPGRRFGGAGGANEIASLCWRTIIMTTQEKRKFVKKVDFISSPGFLDGLPGARERAGLPAGTGPYCVITPQALFGYDEETRYMKLLAIAPWVTVEDVLGTMDFEPIVPAKVEKLNPPKEEELTILRVEIDPHGQTIGEGQWIQL